MSFIFIFLDPQSLAPTARTRQLAQRCPWFLFLPINALIAYFYNKTTWSKMKKRSHLDVLKTATEKIFSFPGKCVR